MRCRHPCDKNSSKAIETPNIDIHSFLVRPPRAPFSTFRQVGTYTEANWLEVDRRLMSDELSDSLGGCSPLRVLADIDTACEQIVEQLEGSSRTMATLAKGPFGVFLAAPPSPVVQPPTADPTPSSHSPDNATNADFGANEIIEVVENQQEDWSGSLCNESSDIFVEALDPSLAFNTHGHGSSDRLLMQDASIAHPFFSDGPVEDNVPVFNPNFGSHTIDQSLDINSSGVPNNSSPQLNIPPVPSPRGLLQELGSPALPGTAEPLLR